jgi:hypothetical protein
MGFIKKEDIRGYYFDGDYVCLECIADKDLSELMEEEIVTERDLEKEYYFFCDRCGNEL